MRPPPRSPTAPTTPPPTNDATSPAASAKSPQASPSWRPSPPNWSRSCSARRTARQSANPATPALHPPRTPLADLLLAWVGTPTWEDSEAFLTSHSQELLTLGGYAALSQLAAARPGDNTLALHVNLLSAVLAHGITAAYAQLRAELAQEQQADMLSEWVSLAADPAASAAYLAEHADDLNNPQAIALLTAECDRQPADPRLWRHLGLLLLADQAADAYAAAESGDPSPFQRSAALLDSGDLDQALAWACLARAADPGPGALLMGQIQTRRERTWPGQGSPRHRRRADRPGAPW